MCGQPWDLPVKPKADERSHAGDANQAEVYRLVKEGKIDEAKQLAESKHQSHDDDDISDDAIWKLFQAGEFEEAKHRKLRKMEKQKARHDKEKQDPSQKYKEVQRLLKEQQIREKEYTKTVEIFVDREAKLEATRTRMEKEAVEVRKGKQALEKAMAEHKSEKSEEQTQEEKRKKEQEDAEKKKQAEKDELEAKVRDLEAPKQEEFQKAMHEHHTRSAAFHKQQEEVRKQIEQADQMHEEAMAKFCIEAGIGKTPGEAAPGNESGDAVMVSTDEREHEAEDVGSKEDEEADRKARMEELLKQNDDLAGDKLAEEEAKAAAEKKEQEREEQERRTKAEAQVREAKKQHGAAKFAKTQG